MNRKNIKVNTYRSNLGADKCLHFSGGDLIKNFSIPYFFLAWFFWSQKTRVNTSERLSWRAKSGKNVAILRQKYFKKPSTN